MANSLCSQNLDAKYISTGKYASINGQQPLAPKPSIAVERETQIPLLNIKPLVNPATIDDPMSETPYKHEHLFHLPQLLQDSTSTSSEAQDLDMYFKACLYFDPEKTHDSKDRYTNSNSISPIILEDQGDAFVQLAQVVADQSVSYQYILGQQNHSKHPDDEKEHLQNINHIITQSQTENRALTLQELISLGSSSTSNANSPRLLATSTIKVRRGESIMDMSFAAMEYWRELGIKPLHGNKNITAFCLCPDDEVYRTRSAKFLREMSDAYRNLNLGSHYLGDTKLPLYTNGIVPIRGLEGLTINFGSLKGYCSRFG